ncbi:AraC family transcriptional regulator [Methylobacterium oxalidis]|uniref:AraC family transcriptional regulator n=1 Tax=Methylobacterium oxalidis TaxID=944322 RepID=A0A512IYW1_9HYPH|nr:AraC family transcriptional regulator [Methylobacterium oxalidis]GEP02897.1 AraC family transcriptional regulator [Methylobacterium oxalidis]GJE30314.1 HTH-type transcriptional regulator VirS [Methylobacterium oxalidis]GLS65830.1 AraC family transcriptional regulator [Methylobacterium oxalidis]
MSRLDGTATWSQSTRPRPHQAPAPPSATGTLARLVVAHAAEAGLDIRPLLRRTGLTPRQIEDRQARVGAAGQAMLLDLVAGCLGDDLLGFRLGCSFEVREIGLVYYVMASAPTLGDAFRRAERYSAITNEGIVPTLSGYGGIRIRIDYVDVPRHEARQQTEFWLTAMVRVARELSGRRLRPTTFALAHGRHPGSRTMEAFLGCPIAFDAEADEIGFQAGAAETPLAGADPYLHQLLRGYCEEALSHRDRPRESLRTRVENAVVPLLPHGRPLVDDIARSLGMSQRTLSRRLAGEGLTFERVLEELRRDLALRYLRDDHLPTSRIAWLLGFQEVAAFTNAFRRWTGRTPSQVRSGRQRS